MQCSRVQRLKKIKASVLAMTVCVSIIAITRVKLRSQLATSDAFAIMSSFFYFLSHLFNFFLFEIFFFSSNYFGGLFCLCSRSAGREAAGFQASLLKAHCKKLKQRERKSRGPKLSKTKQSYI